MNHDPFHQSICGCPQIFIVWFLLYCAIHRGNIKHNWIQKTHGRTTFTWDTLFGGESLMTTYETNFFSQPYLPDGDYVKILLPSENAMWTMTKLYCSWNMACLLLLPSVIHLLPIKEINQFVLKRAVLDTPLLPLFIALLSLRHLTCIV